MSNTPLMHETHTQERALLVLTEHGPQKWPANELAAEFRHLVESAGIEVLDLIYVKVREITPATYIGKGKVEEIVGVAQSLQAGVVIFNLNLSPAQMRNLEDAFTIKTIDRTQLILDIFSLHAKTLSGKLQVELAQLKYLLPRLKGKGVMLSQLGGGIGTRGPGETKLEMDRRKIDDKITRIEASLKDVQLSREVMRKKRTKQNVPLCSLVGYTSAGKTTLFNTLTQSGEVTAASLFTTLDPVSHIFEVNGMKVLLSDTVGFISDLPPQLIEAFKSTLEELTFADCLLHIIDASNSNIERLRKSVNIILNELKLETKPSLLVFNKIDMMQEDDLCQMQHEWPKAVFISAKNGTNINKLKARIHEAIFESLTQVKITLSFSQASFAGYIHDNCEILDTEYTEKGTIFHVRVREKDIAYLESKNVTVKASKPKT
jgi:GTP-binding protein HflX